MVNPSWTTDSRWTGLPESHLVSEVRDDPGGGCYVTTPEGGIAHYEGPDGQPVAARGLSRQAADVLAARLNAAVRAGVPAD
jgi:hypothetical protein